MYYNHKYIDHKGIVYNNNIQKNYIYLKKNINLKLILIFILK